MDFAREKFNVAEICDSSAPGRLVAPSSTFPGVSITLRVIANYRSSGLGTLADKFRLPESNEPKFLSPSERYFEYA